MELLGSIVLSALLILVAWFILGFLIIRENQNAVVVRLGKPFKVIGSGWTWVLFLIDKVARFTTSLIELEFREAMIITARGEHNGVKYGAANIKVRISMYFRWPEDGALMTKTIRTIPNPEDIYGVGGVKDIFEETVLDAFRSEGGCVTWKEITQDRKSFAEKVLQTLMDEDSDPINQAGLPKGTIRLVITSLTLPPDLEASIIKPEVARLNKEATISTAEGEKKRLQLEGEGKAYARKKLYEAIGKETEDIQKEILLTLREMSQGTSNTILFGLPSRLTDSLEQILGKAGVNFNDIRKLFPGLTDEEIIKAIQSGINKLGGQKP